MNTREEIAEIRRIEDKIRELGRDSLTPVEEFHYSHSPYGNGAGCPSTGVDFPKTLESGVLNEG